MLVRARYHNKGVKMTYLLLERVDVPSSVMTKENRLFLHGCMRKPKQVSGEEVTGVIMV